MREDRENLV